MTATTGTTRQEQQVLGRVTELTVRHIGCDPAEMRPGTPFVELGADSLQMINMVRELEREYSVKVGLRELFEQAGTPALLAALVAERSGPPASEPVPMAAPVPVPPAPADAAMAPAHAPVPTSAPAAVAAAPSPPSAPLTLEGLAEQIRVMQEIQLQIMTQLSQLLELQLSGGPQ